MRDPRIVCRDGSSEQSADESRKFKVRENSLTFSILFETGFPDLILTYDESRSSSLGKLVDFRRRCSDEKEGWKRRSRPLRF